MRTELPPARLWQDRDGLITFALSNLVLLLTGGLLWGYFLRESWRTARHTSAAVPAATRVLLLGKRLLPADAISDEYRGRLDRGERILATGDAHQLLLLGGRHPGAGVSEAAAGRAYLLARQHAPERVQVEDRSRNTLENLRNAIELLGAEARRPVALITSRYHLARAGTLGRNLGLDIELCAAEERLSHSPRTCLQLLREAYFLHWYHVGRGLARLLRSRRMLARISGQV